MAAQYGCMIAVGNSGRKYYKDLYLSDSAGAFANFDSGSGAASTSDNKWLAPENIMIYDVCLAAATGQTKTSVVVNGVNEGTILRNSLHLASVSFRPALAIPVASGAQIQLSQMA